MLRALTATALLLSSCATVAIPEDVDMAATLVEEADGSFTVALEFAESQTALVFGQAPVPYRGGVWTSLSEGAAVETIGQVDALVFNEPSTSASFHFQPHTEDLRKAYTPFLKYTDGSWGVLTGQFRLFPAESRAQIEAFDQTANQWEGETLSTQLRLVSNNPITVRGERSHRPVTLRPEGDGTYAFMGDLAPVEGESFFGFIDPGLPAWLNDSFDAELTEIFSQLADGWGYDLPQKSTVLFAYKGAEEDGLFFTGGTLEGGLLSLEVGGTALLDPDAEIKSYLQWFFAHEAAHLFQKAGGTDTAGGDDSWIHEGSANTMAHDIAAELAEDPEHFLMDAYARAFEGCAQSLSYGPLSSADEAGDFDAFYACGDLMALVTDAALPQASLYDFWNELKSSTLAEGGNALTAERYYATMEAMGANAEQMADIQSLARDRHDDPAAFVMAMLDRAGLPMQRSSDGTPTAFTLRAEHDEKALMRRARISG